jgi:chitin synthase
MSFFQRVLFNDRLCELEYELFWKMTKLMKGVTPDNFEVVLMVDADTMVLPDALTYMVATMANDITVMGLCGETRIANKRTSWVTAIQVFEYYISHNYAKAFESLFGMVTCLPGCFSMYRIKSPKNGSWVPILANPDIILEYNQNVVTTLHEKNLLLLGEDRFLSTLMLRTFPKRQMMFVPQARCKTVVPDEFSVLLSQRRRWINSTVHNLFELVLVSDLCGIACLSMQFSIFVDLVGTLVLPAALVMTYYLIIATAISPNPQWQSLGLLLAIIFLPAVLIAITTFKLVYLMWMIGK